MPAEIKPPPYLIRRVPAGRDGCVAVTADVDAGVVEIAVHGRWSPALRMEAWNAVTKCFVEHPAAVLVDLHGLGDPLAASAPAWWTMGMTGARMLPKVNVAVCLPLATPLAARLNRLGAKRYLPLFPTLPQAHAAVTGGLPLTEHVRLHLAPEESAPEQACALVADACRAWDLPRLRPPAHLIMAELVGNAVTHAGTQVLVTVSRRGAGMHLAVADSDPRLPVLADPDPPDQRGLRRVHDTATIWGAIPTPAGKVVWAMVRDPAG